MQSTARRIRARLSRRPARIESPVVKGSLAVLLAVGGIPSAAQALQSGDPGFGKQWVREHPFSIQADSLYPQTWDFAEYFGSGMTLLNKDYGYNHTINRSGQYAHAPWQAILPVPSGNPSAGTIEFNTLRTRPDNIGWIVGDEPNRLRMPDHGAVASYIRQTDPSQLVYTTGAHIEWGAQYWYGDTSHPSYTYNDYLADFVNIIRPDVLVYDMYSFYADGTTHPRFLENIMVVRNKAQATGMPYWAWMQSWGIGGGRYPSESDNRFDIYTHLTAGYTGVLYWTYDYYAGTGDGLITVNGAPTALYYTAAQANAEAARLGRSLRYLTSTDVRFVPGRHIVSGTTTAPNSTPSGMTNWVAGAGGDPHITGVSVDFTKAASTGLEKNGLIGLFTDDAGQNYFMLTNLNHGAGMSASAGALAFTISFDASVNSILHLNSSTSAQEVLTLNNHQLFWNLPGGTGDLFKYNTGAFVDGPPGWAVSSSGDWNATVNWAGGIPNAVGAAATFGNSIITPQTVFTNSAVTVGTLKFDSGPTYQLAGTGSLTIDVASGSGSISVLKGSHKINLPMRLNDNTTADVAAGATLLIADPLTLAAGTTLTKTGSGSLLIEAPVRTAGAAALNVAEGTAELNDPAGTPATGAAPASALLSVVVSGSKLAVGDAQVLRGLDAVTSNPGDQQIDLGGHVVRVYPADRAADEQGIYSDIKSALLSVSGQDGIYDSTKPAGSYALGVTDQSYDAHGDASVLVKLTRLGDANVDGIVDISDLGKLASGWQSLGLWDNGDFNYDGFIDISDLGLLASNWGQSNAGLNQALSSLGLPGVSVPEPSTVGLLLVGFVLAATRRSCHVTKTR